MAESTRRHFTSLTAFPTISAPVPLGLETLLHERHSLNSAGIRDGYVFVDSSHFNNEGDQIAHGATFRSESTVRSGTPAVGYRMLV